MGLAPDFATVFAGDSIGCEVPDPIFSQPLRVPERQFHFGWCLSCFVLLTTNTCQRMCA